MIQSTQARKPAFTFADKYTQREILNDPAKAAAFADEFVRGEAPYFEKCHDPRTGLVYDGIDLDPRTGEASKVRHWSAPSKECLDMGILIKALEGDPKAAQLFGKGDPARAKARAAELLEKKLNAYNEFHKEKPEFAGYLPWYFIEGGKVKATPEWESKIPGLDNGEWMWTMLVAEKSLREQGFDKLADGYKQYNQILTDNVTKVFYDREGVACRGDVRILPSGEGADRYEALNKGSYMTGEHGVHEGCMLIHYLTLFGKGLPEGATEKIWGDIQMNRVETPHGTTWEGFWGSAHESWAHLFLPFRDHKGHADLIRIREEIRSQNAVDRNYPGFATSTNGPKGGYLSAAGIEGVGSQPVHHNDTFAVYGVFPMMLEFSQHVGPGNFALAWLHNGLTAPRMQGPLGGGESVTNSGDAFSAMKTTDGTHPTLLGMMGGLEKETASLMKEKGVYEAFIKRLDSEYQETFGGAPLRDPKPYAAPNTQVPREPLGDYLLR